MVMLGDGVGCVVKEQPMAMARLQLHFKDAKAGKQVFLPPSPPRVVALPIPVRNPSGPPVRVTRNVLTTKTGMTRVELNEAFASVRAAIAEKFASLRRVDDTLPNTVNEILARQNNVVNNINSLVP